MGILDYFTDRVGIRLGRAVRKLVTVDGDVIPCAKSLVTGRTYVACGSERFRKLDYKIGGNTNTSHLHVLKNLYRLLELKEEVPTHKKRQSQQDQINKMSRITVFIWGWWTKCKRAKKARKIIKRTKLRSPQKQTMKKFLKKSSSSQ